MRESKHAKLTRENATLRAELRRVYLLVLHASRGNKEAQAKLTQIAEATLFAERMKENGEVNS